MSLPSVTIDTLLNHPSGICEQYTRAALEAVLPMSEFTAIDILTRDSVLPDGSRPSVQDRLYSIVREDVVTPEGLSQIDEWVSGLFETTSAVTVAGQNCKSQWPQPTHFRRAVMLSELMRHETGGDEQFISGLLSILEGI